MFKSSLLIIASLLLTTTLQAQAYTITGKVYDGVKPIVGATILVLDTKNGTTTNKNGEFTIENATNGTYTLKITYVGFLKKETAITIKDANQNLGSIFLQNDFLQLEQTIVTATRSEILRKDAPILCNLLDDKIFKATQSVTLSEGLSFQPALRIETNCQNCGFNGLRMNGLESAYSQILIDGRPIYNSLQGVYGLEQIPANMVERVEVVRSGGSALYGSSAVAGTVNVITKEPIKNSSYFTTNQAFIDGKVPDKTYMLGADVVNDNQTAGISVNGFSRNRNHWDANGDGYSEMGNLKATSIGLKSFYKPSSLSKLTISGYNIYEYRRGGNNFEKPLHEADIAESTTHNILNGGLTFEQYTSNQKNKFSIYVNGQNLKRDSYYGGGKDINAYGNSEDNSLVTGLQYTGQLGVFAGGNHTLVSGVEYNHNNLQDNAPSYNRFINQTANQTGFYLQDVWEIEEKFNVLLGARVDNHNLIGKPIVSPRANILYKITNDLQFRVGYAKGFRAPQVFDEDLHITQVGGQGAVIRNIGNLTPEYSNAYSSSIDYNKYFDDVSIGMSLDGFYTQLNNVFILEELGTSLSGDLLLERRNGTGANVVGVTLNPKIQYKKLLSFQLGYTLQKSTYDVPVQWSATVANDSKRFFRTPDNYGFYVMTLTANKNISVNFSGVYTGGMVAQHFAGFITDDKLEKTPSFLENNFKINYDFKIKNDVNLVLNTGVQNYTNAYQKDFDLGASRDAAYVYGPSRPRTLFLGMSVKF
ncbi:MAG: TonB-dependent receptor [Sphingobacteriales bacterium]|nr:MAG: TonB-dependent receptor [Sphingobacteriales bacterium]